MSWDVVNDNVEELVEDQRNELSTKEHQRREKSKENIPNPESKELHYLREGKSEKIVVWVPRSQRVPGGFRASSRPKHQTTGERIWEGSIICDLVFIPTSFNLNSKLYQFKMRKGRISPLRS